MAFNAGSIKGTMKMDASGWNSPIKGAVKGVGTLATAVGVAAVAALGKANAAANKWQKSLSNVNTLTDSSVVNSQDMAVALLKLDAELGSTVELTDAMYQAFSAGASDLDEAMDVTVSAAKFARAGLTETATAVDILTTAVNAYGKENMSAEKASDLFFTTVKQGKITGEQLASVIGQSIPLFASSGLALEELNAGMAAMTKQGLSASESTTQLNAIVSSFLKPSEALTVQLQKMGVSSGAAFLEAEGLSGALEMLQSTTGGEADKLAELLPNVSALRGAMALTGTGGKEFSNILGEMATATGATEKAFSKQEKTWDTFRNSMEKVELIVGNVAKFFTDKLAKGATKAAEGVLSFVTSSAGIEVIGNIVAGVAGGFAFLKKFMDPIVEAVGPALSSIFNALTETLGRFSGIMVKSSEATNILGKVSQFAASSLRVFGSFIEKFILSLGDLVEGILAAGSTVGSFFKMLKGEASWNDVKKNAAGVLDAFGNFGEGLWDSVKVVFEGIEEESEGFVDRLKGTAVTLETSFVEAFEGTKDSFEANFNKLITGQDAASEKITKIHDEQNEKVVESTEKAVEKQIGFFGKLQNSWKSIWSESKATFDGVLENMSSSINFFMSGFADISKTETKNALANIDLWSSQQEIALQKKFENGIISQAQYDDEMEQLRKVSTDKKNEEEKKAFEANKSFRLGNLWMTAADAIVGWWSAAAMLGPIAGPIFGAAMSGTTLAMAAKQTDLINKQKFVPAREEGGIAGGLTRINEAGGEIVSLPDGSQVIPHDISNQIARDSGSVQNIVNINNPSVRNDSDIDAIVKKVSRALAGQLRVA